MSTLILNGKTVSVVKVEKVIKLSMCRICLVEDVRMFAITDKNLQELFEKLADIPFVTEDHRPMLVCFFCYAQLKQCGQLRRKCLQAEEWFAQMLNEDYELNPAVYRSQLRLSGGFTVTPIENISIVDECREESVVVKEDPAVSKTHHGDELIQLKVEHLSDAEMELEDDSTHESQEDSPLHESVSDTEDDVPLITLKFEEEKEKIQVSVKKKLAKNTTCTSVAKKPESSKRKVKQEDILPAQHENNGRSGSKIILTTKYCTSMRCVVEDSTETLNKRSVNEVTDHSTTKDTSDHNNSNDHLKSHVRIHNGEKPYECNICQKSFSKTNLLKSHVRIHNGEKPYECHICQKRFSKTNHLKSHVRIHTGEKPYECHICQKRFSKIYHMKSHVLTHTGEKPFECEICRKRFTNKDYLHKHHRIHSGEKSYECNECEKSFTHLVSLKKHIRIHTGEKPYKCDVCQRCFARTESLQQHVRIHTGEKPYSCDICPKSFSRKETLRMHTRLHTGERPFTCYVCQKSFAKKDYLFKHVRKHIVENPYLHHA